jgi:glycosyltransferase involved in cell wall biosynthesis
MRVLLVSSGSGSRGGGEIFLDYLGKGLSKSGHEVIFWIPNHPRMDELAAKCDQSGSIIRADYRNTYDHRGRSLSTWFNWHVSNRIADEWCGLRPDVIHLNKQNLEDGLDLLRAVQKCALPSVCTIHLTQTARYLRARLGLLRDWISYSNLKSYDGIFVAVQDHRRDTLRDFLAASTCTKAIFNGVPRIDPDAARAVREAKRNELGLTDGDFLVLAVGRLVEQKRPFHYLRIARELYTKGIGTKFLWVGDGNLAGRWQDSIKHDNLEDVISCVGWKADVTPYLLAGDLLLHVAEYEGLPFVLIEAMSAGLACAVTRELSREIPFLNESNVLFVDHVEELSNKLRNRRNILQIAEGGRKLFEDRFSLEQMVKSYEHLYVEAIERKRR